MTSQNRDSLLLTSSNSARHVCHVRDVIRDLIFIWNSDMTETPETMDNTEGAVELQTWTDWPGEKTELKKANRWRTYYSFRIKLIAIFSFLLLILRYTVQSR